MDRPPRRGSLEGVDEHLSEIDEALERLCARVSALERGDHVTARPEPRASIDASHGEGVDGARAISRAADATGVVTLVGRTVVVLGGAFLLRAFTDSGRVPPFGGVLLGFAYASTWIGAADLAAIRRPASGFFHGLAGIVIGFPLLIEGATRFGALSATSAAALLLGLAVAILIVSWHRRLQSLAAVTAFAASLTAVVGAITTGHLVPFAAAAIGTGAAASIVCIGRDWHLPAWPPMLAGNLLVIAAAIRSLAPAGLERKGASLTAAIGLAAVYLGLACPSLTPRSVSPRLGDLVRAAISLTGGIGAALLVANDLGGPAFKALGAGLIAAAVVMYAIHLRFLGVLKEPASVFLSSVAVAAFCAGGLAAIPGAVRDLAFVVAAWELVRSARASARPWLYAEATVVAIVYAFSSGLVAFTFDAWTGQGVESVPPALGAAAVVFYVGIMRPDVTETMRWPLAASFIQIAIALSSAAAGVLVLAGHVDGLSSSPGALATERSVVLAISAVALSFVGQSRRDHVFGWLSHGALVLGGIKLVAEDFAVSPPAGMFVAFGAYGLALIVCSRLAKPSR